MTENINTNREMAKTMGRVLLTIFRGYKGSCIVVLFGIFGSAAATLNGLTFMQRLIDDYILPLTGTPSPDFSGLALALGKMILIFLAGILCSYGYNRIMVNVSQGTLRNLREELFTHMESLPIKYFDTHAHGNIMSVYTNDVDTLRQLISQSIPQTVNSLFTLITVLAGMLMMNVPLTIAALCKMCIRDRFIGLKGGTTDELVDALIAELRSMNEKLNIPACIKEYEGGIIDEAEFNSKLKSVAELAVGCLLYTSL